MGNGLIKTAFQIIDGNREALLRHDQRDKKSSF